MNTIVDWKEFVSKLSKNKIKLTDDLERKWFKRFNDMKQEALVIQNEIDKTDREIDRMVYKLYGLTDDEIRIVEGGTL